MWGRISSMAQIVQEKLEESLGEDPVEDVEAKPVASSSVKEDDVDTELRRALRESERRNEEINREFQKLLRQKEEELAELKGTLRTGPTLDAGEAVAETQEPQDGENQASSRDNQQFYAVIAARDTTIAALQNKLEQSESRERQLEQQGRDNEEKVMSELAVKIKTSEMFQLRLEESKQLVEDRNKTIEGLMDRLDAQQRLIESRDQVIDQLKAMKNLDSGADELVSTLREQLEAMNNKVEKAVDEGERARREVSALKRELEEKNEIIAAKDKLEGEKASLLQQIREMEEEHSEAVRRWQIVVQEKEQALAAEFAETEHVYRTTEHDLKEQLDEKTQIIESKDEAIQVLKRAIQEKNLSGEGSSLSPHTDRVVVLLEEKLKEHEEHLNNKSETISKLEKDMAEKEHIIKSLEKSFQEQAAETELLQEACQVRQRELDEIKEKYETELSEKETRLRTQAEANENLEKTVAGLKQSLANVDSKENVAERLLLLDAEKEQQFRDEKQAFEEREKSLHEQLQIALGEKSKLSEELAVTRTEMEAKEKDMNSRMGKLKIQAKAKLAGLQNEKEKLSKEMQEVESHLRQEKEEKLNVQKRVAQVEQEKETAEAKRLELEHALDEFVRSTDKKGMLSALDKNVPVGHVTESTNDQAGEEEMADSSTVSTIVGSINEESGFVNVMKILEEERYGMERRLDLVTKERNSLQSKVEELEEMLEAEKERQHKKSEEISSDEDAEHAKHIAEESLIMHVESLQEENETLRGALELERSAMANLPEQMKETTLNEKLSEKDEHILYLESKLATLQQNLQLFKSMLQEKEVFVMEPRDEYVLQAELESLKDVILAEKEKYANLSSDLEQTKEDYEQRMEEVRKRNEELQRSLSRMESVERELQQGIEDQKTLMEEKDKEIGKLQGALMENSSGFELLNASFSETSSQVQQREEQLEAKEAELEKLQELLREQDASFQELLREQDASFQELKKSYTDVCTKANELQAVLANKEDEMKTLQEKKDKLTSEVDSSTSKQAQSIAEAQNLRDVLEARERELLKLKTMVEEKDSSFEHLNTSFMETSSQVKDLEEIVKAKETQLGILQRSLEEQTLSYELVSKGSSETTAQLKEFEETLAERQSEIDALKVRLEHQGLEFEELKTSCADSTSKVKELLNSCETKDAEVRALKVNLEEQCLNYERLTNSYVELEGEVKGLQDSLSAKEQEVASLQSTLQEQGLASERLGSRCLHAESEAAKLREEQSVKDQQISTLKSTTAELDLTNQQLRSRISETGIQLTDLKDAIAEKDSAIRLLETRIEEQGLEREHLQTSFADASSETRDLRDSLAAKEAELKVLRSSLDDQGSAFTELTSSLSEQSSQLQELNRSLTAKQDENNVLRSNLEDQESRFKQLESEHMAAVAQLHEKLAEIERENKSFSSAMEEQASSYDEASSQLKNLHEILAGKDVELDSLRAAVEDQTKSYDQLCSSRDEANLQIKELQDLLLSKEREVDMLNSSLEKKNLKMDQLNATYSEIVAQVRKEEELLVLKEAEITKLQTSLEEQGTSHAENVSQVKELQEIVSIKDSEIDKLQYSLEEKESDFEQLQLRYSDINSVVTELQQTLSEKDTVVNTLEINLQEQSASLENRCGELLAQVNELQLQLSQKAEELLELQTSLDYSNLSVENLDTSLNEASAQVEELKSQIAARDNKFVALKKKAQALKKSHESVSAEHANLKEELEGLRKEKELFLEEKEAMETCLTQLIELKEQIQAKDEALLDIRGQLNRAEETVQATKRESENSASSAIDLQAKLDIVLQEKEQLKIERDESDSKFQQIIEDKLSMEAATIDSKEEMAFVQSENASVKEEVVELKKRLHLKESETSDLKEVVEHLKTVVEETNTSAQEKLGQMEIIRERELQEKLAVKEKDLLELGADLSQSRAMLNELQNQLRQNEERFNTSKLAFERERDEWQSKLDVMAADKRVQGEELIANKEKLDILSAEFDRAKADLREAREEVGTKDGVVASLQREIAGLQGVVTEEYARSQNDRVLQEQLDSKQTEYLELKEKLQHLQELLNMKENDVARLNKEIQDSREALAEASSRIEDFSSREVEFKKAEETNVELQANLSDVAAELRQVSSEKTALESQFVDVEEKLAASEQELVAVRADLELSNLEVSKRDKLINEMRLTVDEGTRVKEEQALAMSRREAEVNEKIQERDRKLQDVMSELEARDRLCDDQRGKLVELNERHEVTQGKLTAAQTKLDEMASYVSEVEAANASMRHENESRGTDDDAVPGAMSDFSTDSAGKPSLESELLDVNEKLTSLAAEQERTLAELEKTKSELRHRNLKQEIPTSTELVVEGGWPNDVPEINPLLGSVAAEETRFSLKEQELVTQVQHLEMEKEQLEAKLADVVSQVEDLSAARRAIETELGHTKGMLKELTVQHEWTTSELENTKEELQEQENQLNKVRRELHEAQSLREESQRETIRGFEEKFIQKEQELVQVRSDFEAAVAAKIEEITMVKELEKAQVEEQFAKTLEETRSHKDEVIAKLKAKIREKIDLNKKITADFKLKLANAQKEKDCALQELESKRELEIQTIEQLSAALDKASADVKARDGDIETLKEKLEDAENKGEQKDLQWQETLLEIQNLKFELEKRDQEKVEIDTRLQSSVDQQEFDKSIADRNKLIAGLKKKLKEERAGKKEEIATLQSSLAEKDQEVQRLMASHTEELDDVTSRLQASEEDNRRSEEKASAVERELNDAKDEVKSLTSKMEKFKEELLENQERFEKELEEQELDFTSSMDALNSQKDESDKLIQELRREVEELNQRIDRFAEDKSMEQHEKQLLVDEIEHLSEAVELSKIKDQNNSRFEHELDELKREKRALEDQLSLVQGEIIHLKEVNQESQMRVEVAKVESTSPLMDAPPEVGDAGSLGETAPKVVSAASLSLEPSPSADTVFDPAGSGALAKVKSELSDVQGEVTRVKMLNEKLKAKLRTLSKKEKAKSESGAGVDDLSDLRAEVEKARQDKINVEKTAYQLREELDIIVRQKDGLIRDLKANVGQLLDEKTRNETLLKKYEALVLEKDNDIDFLKSKSLEETKNITESYNVLCEEKDARIQELESTLQQEKSDYVDELESTKDGYERILNNNEAVVAGLQRDLDSATNEIAQLENRLREANQSLEELNKLKGDFDHIVSGLRDDVRQALDEKAASDEIAHEFHVQLKESSTERSRVQDVATGTSEPGRTGSVGQHEDVQEERQRLEETIEAMFREKEVLQERIAWLETLVPEREGTRVEHEAVDGRELEEFQAQGDHLGGKSKVQSSGDAEEPNDVLWLQTELKKTSVLNEKLKSKLRAVLKEKKKAKSDPREDDTPEDIRAELERVRAAKLNSEKTIQELRVEVDSFVKEKERIVGDLRSKMDQVLREKERCSSLVEHHEKLLLEKESVIHELTEQLQSLRDDNERLLQSTEELKTASSKLQSSVQRAIDQNVESEREKFEQKYEALLEESHQKIWELQAEMESTKEEYRKEISDIKEQYGDILSRKQREAEQSLAELRENDARLRDSLRGISEERDVIEKQLNEAKSELERSHPFMEEKDRRIHELSNILAQKQRSADEIVMQLRENENRLQKEITELGESCQESDKRLQEAQSVLEEKNQIIVNLEKDLQTRDKRYEEHVMLSRLKADKLEEDLAEARVQTEYLSGELQTARHGWQDINKLKSNFDNIVSGLREDLQRALHGKTAADNIAHEFQVELEKIKQNLPGESRSGAVGVSQQENKVEEMNIRLAAALTEAADLKASLGKALQEKASLQDKVKGLEVLLQDDNKSERELVADSSSLRDSENVKKDDGEMQMKSVSQEVILQTTNELFESAPSITSEAEVEIQNLKNEMQKMKAANERLKSKLRSAGKKKLVKSESEDEDVTGELKAQLEKVRQEKLESEKTLQELRVELDAVVRQKERIISDLKAKIVKLVEAADKSNSVLDQLQQQIAQKDAEIRELKENFLILEREKVEVGRLLGDLEQQNGDLHAQVQEMSSQRARIEEQLEYVTLERERLLQDHLEFVKDKDNTISGLETRLQDTKEQYETEIEATRSQYEEIVFQIQSHADKLERNLQSANEQTERLNVDLSEMKREREDVDNLKSNFDHIVAGLRGDLQRALEEKATAEVIASGFQVRLKRLQNSSARFDEEYKDTAVESTDEETTEEMQQKLESALKEAADLKASLEFASRNIRDLEEKLAGVEVGEQRAFSSLESLRKSDEDLNNLSEERTSSEVLLQSPEDRDGLVEHVATATLTSHSPVDISVGTIDVEEVQRLKVKASQLQTELVKVKNVNERLRAKLKVVVKKAKEAKSDAGDEASIYSLRAELKKTHQEKLDSEKAAQELRIELDGIFRQKEKIVSDLKVRIEELLSEKEQNSSLVEKYEKLLLERDAELNSINEQFQCLSETQEECTRKLAEHQAENLSVKEQLEQARVLKDTAERNLQHATLELESLIQDQQSHLEQKDQRIFELESESTRQKEWYEKQMQAMKDQFESVLFEQRNHSNNLEQALIGANKDVERLKSELREIREAAEDVHKLRSNFDHIVAGLRQDLQQALEGKTAAEEVAHEFKMKLKRIRKSPEGSKTELVDVGLDTYDTQPDLEAVNHKEVEGLQNALELLREENEELKGNVLVLDAVVHDREADVEEKDRRIQELQLEVQRLIAEHASAAEQFSSEINRVTNESEVERGRLDAMLLEKAETCDRLGEEIHCLKEENFSLTEQFGREKGQLEAELGEKRQIVDKLNDELSHLRSGKNKSDEEKLHEELQANYEALETGNNKLRQDLYMTMKEKENVRAKLKKDYEQIVASLNIELEQSRQQNLEKEKLNHILRTEVESLVIEKSSLGEKLRENLGVTKERLLKASEGQKDVEDVLGELKNEIHWLRKECQDCRTEKDQLYNKFCTVTESLRKELEKSLREKDQLSQKIDDTLNQNRSLQQSLIEKQSTLTKAKLQFEHIGKGWRSDLEAARAEKEEALKQLRERWVNQTVAIDMPQDEEESAETLEQLRNRLKELEELYEAKCREGKVSLQIEEVGSPSKESARRYHLSSPVVRRDASSFIGQLSRLCRRGSSLSVARPRGFRKAALALYFVALHLLAFMYLFQVLF